MNNNFFEHVQEAAIKAQDNEEKEYIYDEELIKAFVIINDIAYENVYDLFLALSALNLINTYVKQEGVKLSYQFKEHITSIFAAIERIHPEELRVYLDYLENRNNCVYFIFDDFQFSFQQIKKAFIPAELVIEQHIEWDGIRKQYCASTIFNMALQCPYLSQTAEAIKNKLPEEVAAYYDGYYKFKRGQLVKLDTPESTDLYLDSISKVEKNYYRELLRDYVGKRIIVIGKCKQIYPEYVTFTDIRPYMEGHKTKRICDHINLFTSAVQQVIPLEDLVKGRKYYICGYCNKYGLAKERIGMQLALDLGVAPLELREYDRPNEVLIENSITFDDTSFILRKIEKVL